MTEEEWLECEDHSDLLAFIKTQSRYSRRTLTLLGAAGCRRLADMFPAPVCLEAIEAVEEFADGTLDAAHLQAVRDRLAPYCGGYTQTVRVFPVETANAIKFLIDPDEKHVEHVVGLSSEVLGLRAVHAAGKIPETLPYEEIPQFWYEPEFDPANKAALAVERGYLRDIFGNPFRPVTFLPEWRTSTVVALATGIYAERAFDRMPILADALQDAGCDNEDILNHCRSEGVHVRGCWVVDLVLAKE
jgi:hypothetical protein